MRGRPKAELILSEGEREQLTALTMRRKTAQAQALRARIVLACADGIDNALRPSPEMPSFNLRRLYAAWFRVKRPEGGVGSLTGPVG